MLFLEQSTVTNKEILRKMESTFFTNPNLVFCLLIICESPFLSLRGKCKRWKSVNPIYCCLLHDAANFGYFIHMFWFSINYSGKNLSQYVTYISLILDHFIYVMEGFDFVWKLYWDFALSYDPSLRPTCDLKNWRDTIGI